MTVTQNKPQINKPRFTTRADFLAWQALNPAPAKSKPVKTNNTQNLEKFRKAGFTVRVKHFRSYGIYSSLDSSVIIDYLTGEQAEVVGRFTDVLLQSRGGYTEIKATRAGKTYTVASTCHDDDNYCYALGVKYALERLNNDIKNMEGVSIL